MITPTLSTVHDAFVSGLDGNTMSDGSILTCRGSKQTLDSVGDGNLPFLLLETGNAVLSEWDSAMYQVSWDIPGELKVKGPTGEVPRIARTAIDDVLGFTARLRGLFVDDAGQVYAISDKAVQLYRDGRIQALAIRGGPILKSFRVMPELSGQPYITVQMMFHLEYIADKSALVSIAGVEEFIIGIQALDPGRERYPYGDPETPPQYQIPFPTPAADVVATGMFAGPDNTLPPGVVQSSPPFPGKYKSVKGVPYTSLVKELSVLPSAVSMSHTATQQLSVIALQLSGAGIQATATATYQSSDQTKATVSASGLITGVAAGSCNITVSYGGATFVVPVTLT